MLICRSSRDIINYSSVALSEETQSQSTDLQFQSGRFNSVSFIHSFIRWLFRPRSTAQHTLPCKSGPRTLHRPLVCPSVCQFVRNFVRMRFCPSVCLTWASIARRGENWFHFCGTAFEYLHLHLNLPLNLNLNLCASGENHSWLAGWLTLALMRHVTAVVSTSAINSTYES